MTTYRQLFITATDTGVGKTMVSGLLLGHLLEKGIRAGYQKWAATGGAYTVEDLDRVRILAGLSGPLAEPIDLVVPYRLPYAASPHLAAELVGQQIAPDQITKSYERLRDTYEVLLVEGVGGLMVPLRRDLLLIDLLARLKLPALLVARTSLGTLNHTLLSLEAMRSRRVPVLGLLLTDGPDEDETIAADNLKTLAEIGRVEVFGRLPFRHDDQALRAAFQPLAEVIFARLRLP